MKHLSAIFLATALVFSVSCATAPGEQKTETQKPQEEQASFDPQASYDYADALVRQGRFTDAHQELEKIIRKSNYTKAMTALAGLKIIGIGDKKDVQGGIALFERAASLNDPEAMFVLGHMYLEGEFIPQDFARARYWLEKVNTTHPNLYPAANDLQKLKSMGH